MPNIAAMLGMLSLSCMACQGNMIVRKSVQLLELPMRIEVVFVPPENASLQV